MKILWIIRQAQKPQKLYSLKICTYTYSSYHGMNTVLY